MADTDQDLFGENKASTSPEETEDKLFGEDNTTEISLDDDDTKQEPESLPESSPVEPEPFAPPPASSVMIDDDDTPTTPSALPANKKSQVYSLNFAYMIYLLYRICSLPLL